MKKIVLIGDSIRVGYCRYVQQVFEGEAKPLDYDALFTEVDKIVGI